MYYMIILLNLLIIWLILYNIKIKIFSIILNIEINRFNINKYNNYN